MTLKVSPIVFMGHLNGKVSGEGKEREEEAKWIKRESEREEEGEER